MAGVHELLIEGAGVDRASRLAPPPRKKGGSIDGTPQILPRLTPGPERDPAPKIGKK